MSLFDRLLGKRRPDLMLDLDQVITTFGGAASDWEQKPVDFELLRARLADACRDSEIPPMPPDGFDLAVGLLTGDAARRFAVFIAGFDLPAMHEILPSLVDRGSIQARVVSRLVSLATELSQLTLSLLQQSDVRLEEFARHFCAKLEIEIVDETVDVSTARLHEINYARLMELAERVKLSASDRVEYLRKLQEEEEKTRRPRRGKW